MQEKCRKIPAVFPPNLLHRKRYTHPYWGITVGYFCTFKFTSQWKKKSKSNRNQASPVYSLIWRRTNFQIRLDFKSQHNYRHSLIDNKQLSPQQRPCNKKTGCSRGMGRRRRNKKCSEWCFCVGRTAVSHALSIFIGAFVYAKTRGAHKVKPASKPRLYFYIQ